MLSQVYRYLKFGKDEQKYASTLGRTVDDLERFNHQQLSTMPKVDESVKSLSTLIPKANAEMNMPENRNAELLKRLALGAIVSTFFLSVLRYVGNLYRNYDRQLTNAESDDLAIRKFYVAYKASTEDKDHRAAVLTAFMAPNKLNEPAEQSDNLSKQEADVIKELLTALARKI